MSADLKTRVGLCFRAGMLKEAVTRPGMDDSALSGLAQYVYFATSEILSALPGSDYLRRVTSGGEYEEDWEVVPTVDVLYPDRGGVTGRLQLRDVHKP